MKIIALLSQFLGISGVCTPLGDDDCSLASCPYNQISSHNNPIPYWKWKSQKIHSHYQQVGYIKLRQPHIFFFPKLPHGRGPVDVSLPHTHHALQLHHRCGCRICDRRCFFAGQIVFILWVRDGLKVVYTCAFKQINTYIYTIMYIYIYIFYIYIYICKFWVVFRCWWYHFVFSLTRVISQFGKCCSKWHFYGPDFLGPRKLISYFENSVIYIFRWYGRSAWENNHSTNALYT